MAAIRSAQWHRTSDQAAAAVPVDDYRFEAIDHLFAEASMREAGIQEHFSRAEILPMTVVYEDLVAGWPETVRAVLSFVGAPPDTPIPGPPLAPTADPVTDIWAERFREERQRGWSNRGW